MASLCCVCVCDSLALPERLQCLFFELPNAFPGEPILPADLIQCGRRVAIQAVVSPENGLPALWQRGDPFSKGPADPLSVDVRLSRSYGEV